MSARQDDARSDLVYRAFRKCWRGAYHRYLTVRLGCAGAAQEVAERAFEDLAVHWGRALSSPSPEAVAWHLLQCRIPDTAAGGAETLYRQLAARQADVLVLRQRLGLSLGTVAQLLGCSPCAVAGDEAAALRTLRHWHMPRGGKGPGRVS